MKLPSEVFKRETLGWLCCLVAGALCTLPPFSSSLIPLPSPSFFSLSARHTLIFSCLSSFFLCALGLLIIYSSTDNPRVLSQFVKGTRWILASLLVVNLFCALVSQSVLRLLAYVAWCCSLLGLDIARGLGALSLAASSLEGGHAEPITSPMAGPPRLSIPALSSALESPPSFQQLWAFARSLSDSMSLTRVELDPSSMSPALIANSSLLVRSTFSSDGVPATASLGASATEVEQQRAAAQALHERSRDEELRREMVEQESLLHLLSLCSSEDADVALSAHTALYNLSLDSASKPLLKVALPRLVLAARDRSPALADMACATLYSLSVCPSMCLQVVECGAVAGLARALRKATGRGKLDALTALYYLTNPRTCLDKHEQVVQEVVRAGALRTLVRHLANPQAPDALKACHVLRNLTKSWAGCDAVMKIEDGIPNLVAMLDDGPAEAQEDAAASLLSLAEHSAEGLSLVWQEAPMMGLERLQRLGSRRASRKATILLNQLSSLSAE